jgi:Sigma-70 region 2
MDTQLRNFIQAAQGGDLEAFGAIVKRFQGMACATASTMLDDAGLAEDVVQEAFIEAYQNLPKLREIDAFPGWFRRIITPNPSGSCSTTGPTSTYAQIQAKRLCMARLRRITSRW